MEVGPGAVVAIVLVSLALMVTGGITGLISGKPPLFRALRQLAIGLGAAGITYLLGLLFAELLAWHFPHTPKISASWPVSWKPYVSATWCAHFSMGPPSISSVRPQLVHTKWWW